jgi:hypothetical protein
MNKDTFEQFSKVIDGVSSNTLIMFQSMNKNFINSNADQREEKLLKALKSDDFREVYRVISSSDWFDQGQFHNAYGKSKYPGKTEILRADLNGDYMITWEQITDKMQIRAICDLQSPQAVFDFVRLPTDESNIFCYLKDAAIDESIRIINNPDKVSSLAQNLPTRSYLDKRDIRLLGLIVNPRERIAAANKPYKSSDGRKYMRFAPYSLNVSKNLDLFAELLSLFSKEDIARLYAKNKMIWNMYGDARSMVFEYLWDQKLILRLINATGNLETVPDHHMIPAYEHAANKGWNDVVGALRPYAEKHMAENKRTATQKAAFGEYVELLLQQADDRLATLSRGK